MALCARWQCSQGGRPIGAGAREPRSDLRKNAGRAYWVERDVEQVIEKDGYDIEALVNIACEEANEAQ